MKRKIGFVDTALRDAHQSLVATRMTTQQMLPVLELMDNAGYHALEVWGGATFDASLRFLNEDPWDRLRTIRSHVKNTKLQMLLRGQNLLGYHHYPDDVVEAFIEKSIENGIDIIRVFDALNDANNLKTSMKAIKKYGGECQACICYTISEIHTNEYYVDLVETLVEMGADSIAVKDMAGILTPANAYSLVTDIKKATDIPLEIHTHCSSGIAEMTYLKSIEAGADIIDTAISPLSGGTSQPPTESMAMALKGLGYETDLDQKILSQIADHFKIVKDEFRAEGLLNPKVMDVEPNTLIYQIPGGMISNLVSQLTEAGKLDLYDQVLKEVPRVRKELGYPPLVTPMSQMVGTQAVMNVMVGERYKMIPKEIKDYVLGRYGKTPGPIDPEVREMVLSKINGGNKEEGVEKLAPAMDKYRSELGDLALSTEDVLTYASFPKVAVPFFERRAFKDVPEQYIEIVY